MSRVGALVPFKRFTRAKRRLRTRFSDAEVEEIGRAMLADVLTALGGARSLERVVVLTDDEAVAEVARALGADVRLREPDPGLNAVIDAGSSELAADGFDASLVVLGDLPLLRAEHVDALLGEADDAAVVVVPSDDKGTAMLLRRPPCAIEALFGSESAARHEAAASAAGLAWHRSESAPRIVRLDLDTPDDVRRVLESGHPCRTRDVLRKVCS